MMIDIHGIIQEFYENASGFCGGEHVLHAIFYSLCLKRGLNHQQIAREYNVDKTLIDIAIFNDDCDGDFTNPNNIPHTLIEFKGGAYGTRNALKDTIDKNGYCSDYVKLSNPRFNESAKWLVAVDMPELKVSITDSQLINCALQAERNNFIFSYYCQHKPDYYVSEKGTIHKKKLSIKPPTPKARTSDILDILNGNVTLKKQTQNINGHEANNAALLYSCLRDSHYAIPEVSLETYFNLANFNGKRMQSRPDLVIFNNSFDGCFNLYKNGDKSLPNDAHKLSALEAIIEIKGSAGLNNATDNKLKKLYEADIAKLIMWRNALLNNGASGLLKTIFWAVDNRKSPININILDEIKKLAMMNDIEFIYYGRIT
tara:strand:- start:7093 stop:8205 length:1113 start_codon:yes stop_codon:yes gene_type:complete